MELRKRRFQVSMAWCQQCLCVYASYIARRIHTHTYIGTTPQHIGSHTQNQSRIERDRETLTETFHFNARLWVDVELSHNNNIWKCCECTDISILVTAWSTVQLVEIRWNFWILILRCNFGYLIQTWLEILLDYLKFSTTTTTKNQSK